MAAICSSVFPEIILKRSSRRIPPPESGRYPLWDDAPLTFFNEGGYLPAFPCALRFDFLERAQAFRELLSVPYSVGLCEISCLRAVSGRCSCAE